MNTYEQNFVPRSFVSSSTVSPTLLFYSKRSRNESISKKKFNIDKQIREALNVWFCFT